MALNTDQAAELAKLCLVACDMSYKGDRAVPGEPLAPYFDPVSIGPEYDISDNGFTVLGGFEDSGTGFKSVILENRATQELIVSFAGTDGLNPKDWWSNTNHLGDNQWRRNERRILPQIRSKFGEGYKVHFTGQSLGGALAQYAAYDFLDGLSLAQRSRVSLTTFNSLGGRDGLQQDEVGFDVSRFNGIRRGQHYVVFNDLVSRLGGGFVGGNQYLLEYRDLGDIDPRGNPHAFGIVDGHRIESGFYANLSAVTDYFSFAVERSVAPLAIPDLQRLAANFGNLFRRETVNNTAAVLDLFAAALYTAVRAPNDQIRELIGAVVDHSNRAGDISDESASFLKAVPWGAAAKSVATFSALASPLTFVTTFVGSIFLRLVASGFDSALTDAQRAIKEEFGGNSTVSVGDAPTLQDAGVQLQVLKARGDNPDLGAVNGEALAEHLAGGTDWASATLDFVQETPELSPEERVRLDSTFGAVMYDAVLSTPEISPVYIEEFLGVLTAHFEEAGKKIANSNPDLVLKYANVEPGQFGALESFAAYDAVHDSLADAVDDPSNASIKDILERELAIVESAGQVISIQTLAAKSENPFDNAGFSPELAPLASDQLVDRDSGTYVIFLPYEAGESGQRIRVSLSGSNADQFAVASHGEEVAAIGGEFYLTVPEGRRSINFAIAPTDDFDGTEILAIDATLVDAAGNATHQTHREANLSIVDLTDSEISVVFNALPETEVLTGTRHPETSALNDPKSRRTQLNGTALGDYIIGNHASEEIKSGAGNDFIYEEQQSTTGFFRDADDVYAGGGNDWVFGSLGSDGRVIDLGEGDDLVKAANGPRFARFVDIAPGHPAIPPGLYLNEIVPFADFAPALSIEDDGELPIATADGRLQFGFTLAFTEPHGGSSKTLRVVPTPDVNIEAPFPRNAILPGGGASYELTPNPDGSASIVYHGGTVPATFKVIVDFAHDDSVPTAVAPLNVRAGAGNDRVFGGADEDFLQGEAGDDRLAGYGADDTLLAGPGNDLVIAGEGNDYVDLGSGSNKAWGESGDDALLGGDDDDLLVGDSETTPIANQGSDYLDGGGGDDELIGNGGDDELFGGDGNDDLAGDAGDDYLDGESGNDTLAGGSGTDTLHAGAGDDELDGGNGDDYLDGEAGHDVLLAGDGDDTVLGGDGDDTLAGDAANDTLDGESGDDVLAGGAGDDTLHGGKGNDHLSGGEGNDIYVFAPGSGDDVIFDVLGSNALRIKDVFDIRVTASGAGDLLLEFGPDDTITIKQGFVFPAIATFDIAGETLNHREFLDHFTNGSVSLDGDAMLDAADDPGALPVPANITLFGGGQADVLTAGALNAIGLQGGAGNDLLVGGAGADVLDGGHGADTLSGGGGADILAGGSGDDRYQIGVGDGEDTVTDVSGINTIAFGAGVLPSDVATHFAADGAGNVALAVQYDMADVIHLAQVSTNLANFIFIFADGSSWTTQDLLERSLQVPVSLGASDTGAALFGSRFGDELTGGSGNDVLEGGPGADTLSGGAGNDVYRFQRADGIDTITDAAGATTIEFANPISPFATTAAFVLGANGERVLELRYAEADLVRIAEIGTNLAAYGFRFADGTQWTTEDLLQAVLPDAVHASAGTTDAALFGSRFDDVLRGRDGNDLLMAAAGDDILAGGRGNDSLSGSAGDDTYLFGLGDGVDRIRDLFGTNTLVFGEGISVDMLALSLGSLQINVGDNGDAVHLETFDAGNPEAGADIQTFRFADGSAMTLEDLLANRFVAPEPFIFEQGMGARTVGRRAWISEIRVAPPILREDIHYTRNGSALIVSGTGSDNLRIEDWFANTNVARPGVLIESHDTFVDANSITAALLELRGSSAPDTLSGLDGFADSLFGEAGNDRLLGLSGDDQLHGGEGNDILEGGDGADFLAGGAGASFFAGGRGADFVYVESNPEAIVAFRAGDGADQIAGSAGTLSIGGDISRHELTLSRDSDDLVLAANADDSVRLISWFAESAAPRALDLQVFGPDGVRTYDLAALAKQLQAMQQLDPVTVQWTPGVAIEQALISTSSDHALGGAIAHQYATSGNLNALTPDLVRAVLDDSIFGRVAQPFVFAVPNRPPHLARPLEDQTAAEDAPFNLVVDEFFADQDGNALAYTATLEGGSELPAWLSLDGSTGAFAGTPRQSDVGVVAMRVTATDGGGLSASDVFLLSVANVNDAPVVSAPLASRSFELGTPFAFSIPRETFADADPGDPISLSAGLFDGTPLPRWLNFDAASGMFSGNAPSVGVTHITVRATDAAGESAVSDFGLIVRTPADASVSGGTGNDLLYGGSGDEVLSAKGGSDYLYGDVGNDLLRGGAGTDVLQGGDGDDTLRGGRGHNVLDGGVGDDVLYGGQGSSFLAGGAGNDVLRVGQGNDVIAFNLGDGIDTIYGGRDGGNTLSLGGGIRYENLSFSKHGKDLVVNVGAADRILLKNWYNGNKSLLNLQLVQDAVTEFEATSADPLYRHKVQTFDFLGLVSAFDAARAATPGLTSWALTNALLEWHLSNSDEEALGGDLAYWYGKNRGLSGISIQATQEVLGASGFGSDAQALRPFAGLQEGFAKLS